jgi:tetratricopeptide (TPR) repeat protein
MSIAYLSRIEAGQRRPDVRLLEVIAGRLETTVEALLGEPSQPAIAPVEFDLRFAELTLSSGEAANAASRLQALIEGHERLPTELVARATWLLAGAREALGEYAEAIRLLEWLDSSEAGPISPVIGVALSRCYREAGDLFRAIEIGRAAQVAVGEHGLEESVEGVQLLVTLAAAYHERGDTVVARNLCIEAIERAERSAAPAARASAYWNASIVARRAGDPKALPLAEKALAILGELEDGKRLAQMRLQIGILLVTAPEPDFARAEHELLQARVALVETGASAASVSRCDGALALVFVGAGDLDGAWESGLRAREAASEAPLALAHAEAALGRVALARRDEAEARRRFGSAAAALTAAAADREAAQLWLELGVSLDEAGETEAARDAYRSAAAASGLRLPAHAQRIFS